MAHQQGIAKIEQQVSAQEVRLMVHALERLLSKDDRTVHIVKSGDASTNCQHLACYLAMERRSVRGRGLRVSGAQETLDRPQHGLSGVKLAGERQRPGIRQCETRRLVYYRRAEHAQPVEQ